MQKTVGLAAHALAASLLLIAARPAAAALVAYYPLDGNVNDVSGNNYNGIVSGTAAYTTGARGASAFAFNGSTNISTTTTDNLGLVNQSFTVDTFVKFGSLAFDEPVLATFQTGIQNGLHLIARSGLTYMGFYADDTQGHTPLAVDTWYNIAWVYDVTAQTQTIYLNGVLDSQGTGRSPFLGSGETVFIGAGFDGTISGGAAVDNLKFYNTALTQAEVQVLLSPEPRELMVAGLAFVAMLTRRRRYGRTVGRMAGGR
jgi:hypothetical protein